MSYRALIIAMMLGLPMQYTGAVSGLQSDEIIGAIHSSSDEDVFLFQGLPGDKMIFEIYSDEFTPHLVVGANAKNNPKCTDCVEQSANTPNKNAQVLYVIPNGGNVYVRAGSVNGFGKYKLLASSLNTMEVKETTPHRLGVGSIKRADLSDAAAIDDNGRYFHAYQVVGKPNQVIKIKMISNQFKPKLATVNEFASASVMLKKAFERNSQSVVSDNIAQLTLYLDEKGRVIFYAIADKPLQSGTYQVSIEPDKIDK